MLGFTGGVMIAAGFMGGSLLIYLLDKLVPHLHINVEKEETEGNKMA